MDARVFRMTLLTIVSAFILVMVIIYATNADKINKLLGGAKENTTSEVVVSEEVTTGDVYGQQIGDDLKSFLYDEDFFDDAEEIPAVVVIPKNTNKPENSENSSEYMTDEEEDSGMAVVGQLENPDMLPEMPISEMPLEGSTIEGTPVGTP